MWSVQSLKSYVLADLDKASTPEVWVGSMLDKVLNSGHFRKVLVGQTVRNTRVSTSLSVQN